MPSQAKHGSASSAMGCLLGVLLQEQPNEDIQMTPEPKNMASSETYPQTALCRTVQNTAVGFLHIQNACMPSKAMAGHPQMQLASRGLALGISMDQ